MFREEVKLKDGFVKTVVAGSEEELAEGVAAVQDDSYPVSPDLHDPKVANQIVSPENKAIEDAPVFIDNDAHEAVVEDEVEEVPAEKPAKKAAKK